MTEGVRQWPTAEASPLSASTVLVASVAAFALSGIVFTLLPQTDIAVASLFYVTGHRFVGNVFWVGAVRYALQALFAGGVALAAIAFVRSVLYARAFRGLAARQWLFVLLALAIGPGLVANVLLKDQIGRPRPSQTQQFGGKKQFAPPLVASAECHKNCSFVSGEASSMFVLFFAFAFVSAGHKKHYLAAGVLAGSLAGLIRMSEGGHYLSDIVFAGIFMAVTVAALKLVLFEAWPAWRRQTAANFAMARAS